MAKITEDEFIRFVEKMPAFPQSVHKILQLAADPKASTKDIVAVIESDPVMAVKILKVVNSAFYSLPREVLSIQRALVFLGILSLKNLALSVAAIGMLNPENAAEFDINKFLEHSLVTAVLAKKLAMHVGISMIESSDYFIAGLLHDFGKIVFAEFMPHEFNQALIDSKEHNISLHQAELEHIGLSHDKAGQLLVSKWALSDTLANAINWHHGSKQDSCLADCIFAANQIAKKYKIGDGGNAVINDFPEHVYARFSMTLDELIVELGDISEINSEVQQFIGA